MQDFEGVPISAYLSTATLCLTLNRFRFTASSFPIDGYILPNTLLPIGIKIGEPTISHYEKIRTLNNCNCHRMPLF